MADSIKKNCLGEIAKKCIDDGKLTLAADILKIMIFVSTINKPNHCRMCEREYTLLSSVRCITDPIKKRVCRCEEVDNRLCIPVVPAIVTTETTGPRIVQTDNGQLRICWF